MKYRVYNKHANYYVSEVEADDIERDETFITFFLKDVRVAVFVTRNVIWYEPVSEDKTGAKI